MTTQTEAAENEFFWFVRWNGIVAVCDTLEKAHLGAFFECDRLVTGAYATEDERVPTGATFTIYHGRRGVAQVTIRQPDPDTEPHFVWSHPRSDELNDITPEEYAHLIQRRREAK